MIPDAFNMLRKLTFRKMLNILLVQLSFHLSTLMKKPVVWGKPWFISIEPASICNLACPQCPTGKGDITRQKPFMDPGKYRELLDELSPTTALLSLYFQGEPLMHRDFTSFVKAAADKKIYTQTASNGQLLTENACRGIVDAGLDRIIISLDGADQESYQAYRRGGDIEKVKNGIRTLERVRRERGSGKPFIVVQFLVFKHNRHQLMDVKKLAGQLGADKVWIKTAQMEYPDSADEWIPEDPHLSRYAMGASGEWALKGKLRNRCRRLWQTAVITSDGMILPCCFDKRAAYTMGSAVDQGIGGTWKNKSYQDFRKGILINRKETAICVNCTEGIGRIFN